LLKATTGVPLGELYYLWKRNGLPITGSANGPAADSLYTLTQADANSAITVTIWAENLLDSLTSVAVTVKKATLTGAIAIVGIDTAGNTLRVGTALLKATTGVPLGELYYLWKRNGLPIAAAPSAADSVYTLTQADANSQITVTVWAKNTLDSVTSAAIAVKKATLTGSVNLANTTIASIISIDTVGNTLRVDTAKLASTPAGVAPGELYYLWKRNGKPIGSSPSAADSLYRLTLADTGSQITVTVWAENLLDSLTSAAVAVKKATLSGSVLITGACAAGSVLTADITQLASKPLGVPPGALSYRWKRDGAPITNANARDYLLLKADIGKRITVTVWAENLLDSLTSEPTDLVANFSYTVCYVGNGSDNDAYTVSSTHPYGAKTPLRLNTYTRSGYRFDKWTAEEDGGGKSYQDGEMILNLCSESGDTITLYAQWKRLSAITIAGATLADKTYDGTNSATVTKVAFGGLAAGETLRLGEDYTVDSARFTDKNAGTGKTVHIYVSLVNAGAAAQRYALKEGESPYALKNQSIAKREIAIAAAFVAPKTYDGTVSAAVDSVRFGNLVAGETLRLGEGYAVSNAHFTDENAGENKTVKIYASLASAGATAQNYALTNGNGYEQPNQRIKKVAPGASHLDVAPSDLSVAYDGAAHGVRVALKSRYSGMNNIAVKYAGSSDKPVDVGKYAVTVDLTGNANFSDSTGMLLDTLAITKKGIAIKSIKVAQKIYNGTNSATVSEVAFDGLAGSEMLTLGKDYTVSNAYFNSADAGSGKTATAYVSLLSASGKAHNYALLNGTHEQRGQTILRSPQTILFPSVDTTIYVNDGAVTLGAKTTTPYGAPLLPARFRLTPAGTQDATLAAGSGSSTLTPRQPGTVYVTAAVESNPNYEDAAEVRRKFTITDRDSFTVAFNSNGGSAVPSVRVAKADTVGQPKKPQRGDLVFGGWYAGKAYKSEWRFSSCRVTQDTTLYARWGYRVKFIYSFDEGGVAKQRDTVVADGGTATPPPDTVRAGYRFGGWYANENLSGLRWSFSRDTIRQNETLYAKWDTIRYSIIYHLNALNGKNHASNPDAFTATSPDVTIHDAALMGDSTFAGWYANANLTGSPVTKIPRGSTENRTLWAKWTSEQICRSTNLCSLSGSIPNVSCPSFAHYGAAKNKAPYYFDSSGGGADDDGDGVPNINDPDAPHFLLPGGGGDTSYCGYSIQNTQCPDFPGFSKAGGGQNCDRIITVTYADSTFNVAPSRADTIPAGEATRWTVLTRNRLHRVATLGRVAAAKDSVAVHIEHAGSSYLIGYLPPKGSSKYSRVLLRAPLTVLKRPLYITAPTLQASKTFDRSDSVAGKVIPGKLRNLIPADTSYAGKLTVEADARYASAEIGSPSIAVAYTLRGEAYRTADDCKAYYSDNYEAPENVTLAGRITPRPLWVEETVQKAKKYDGSDLAAILSIDSLHSVLEGDSIVLSAAAAKYGDAEVGKNKLIVAEYAVSGDPAKLGYYVRTWRDTVHRDGEITPPSHNDPDSSDFWECPNGGGCTPAGDSIPKINNPKEDNYYEQGGGGDTSYCRNGIPNVNCPEYPYYDSIGGGGHDGDGDGVPNINDPDADHYYQPGGGGDASYCGEKVINLNCPSYPGFDRPGGGGYDDDGDGIPNINDPDSDHYNYQGGGGDTSICGNGIPNVNCPEYPCFDRPGGGGYDDDGDGTPNINDPNSDLYDKKGGGGDTSICGKGIPNVNCPEYPCYDSIGGGGHDGDGDGVPNINDPDSDNFGQNGGGGDTTICGNGIPNVNCPGYDHFDEPGGGGDDSDGDGIPNVNDPDSDNYDLPGGGGDTSICGNGIPNVNCPEYDHFDEPGGGGDDSDGDGIPNVNDPDSDLYDKKGGGGDTSICGNGIPNVNCPGYDHFDEPGGGGADSDGDSIPDVNDPDSDLYDKKGGGGDTSICGNGIPNVNCPGYGYFDEPGGGGYDSDGDSIPDVNDPDSDLYDKKGGGGDTTICGNGIPGRNCPDSPSYDLTGGGGDTSLCGNGILNVDCPDYDGYNEAGGGGGGSDSSSSDSGGIRHDAITVTYCDTSFRFFPDPNVIGERQFDWVSLNPEVARISPDVVGLIFLAGRGSTSVMCVALPDAGDERQSRRVVMNIALTVAPKPLAVAGTWVDTIKTYDGTSAASVVAGALQGVLPQDAASVSVTATAYYSAGSHATPGSGKPIVVTYALTGSRAYCYVAPKNDTLSGTIVQEDGAYCDVVGIVMKKDAQSAAAVPYAGVSVAYSVNGAPAKTATTDAYGCYIISGLKKDDVVTLRPQEIRAWVATPSKQTLTAGSGSVGVVLANAFTYTPDAASLVALTLCGDIGGELARWERGQIGDTTYYELPCDQLSDTLRLEYTTPPGITGSVNVGESEDENEGVGSPTLSSAGQSGTTTTIPLDVSKPGRKIVSIDLSSGKRYTLVMDRPHGIFDFVTEHLGNIRIVVNNPEVNGGFLFASCDWWYKKDGEENYRMVQSGEQLYYTAGPTIRDKFLPNDSMYVVLRTAAGATLRTCPDIQGNATATASGGSNAKSEEDVDDSAYPNPVRGGSKVYLKRSIIAADGQEELYATFRLFTSMGKLVSSGEAAALTDGLTMPEHAGAYFLILDGKAGRKIIRITVGR
jgi:uncharacterized repeat protein (TIGR02543 family)